MDFKDVFPTKKPIIGMIHMTGDSTRNKISRARSELTIYQLEEVDGAIIEDYHGSPEDVELMLKKSRSTFPDLKIGINILRDPFSAFELADKYDASFVQLDSVQTIDLEELGDERGLKLYDEMRSQYPHIAVLGGVGFKYKTQPSDLELALAEGKSRCEAIVTTGPGTGIETPSKKLKEYKELLSSYPLIVGAGVNLENIAKQLSIVDGAIIGTYFKKDGNESNQVERGRIKKNYECC